MQEIKNVVEYIEKYKNFDDGTYNIDTGETVGYNIGYQVSFVRPEAFTQLNNHKWDAITNHFCEYFDSLAHIGVYNGDAEVSFHSLSEDKAMEVMKRFNQESILDWKRKKEQPECSTNWFILNRLFDEKKVVNYDEILEEI